MGGILWSMVSAASPGTDDHPVLELRQYKIVPHQRDSFILLFEQEFVETQEALGMKLIGQFRDHDDENRFVWLREFSGMQSRGKALSAFYTGPVWQAHRNEANPLLDDNDDVLLLRPAGMNSDFAASASRAARGAAVKPGGLVIAHILYLWKDPNEGFVAFFDQKIKSELARAGIPAIAAFVPETTPNNFPRLPVRQGEKVFVWFTRSIDRHAYDRAWSTLTTTTEWRRELAPRYADAQERAAQILFLEPTPRSALR